MLIIVLVVFIKMCCVFNNNFNYSRGSVNWLGNSILFKLINSRVMSMYVNNMVYRVCDVILN